MTITSFNNANRVTLSAQNAPWSRRIEFLLCQGDQVAHSVTFADSPDGHPCEPTFSLDISDGQSLMDGLWSAGLRPTEGSGSAGSLKATQNHLEDMRRIAFETLAKPPLYEVKYPQPIERGDILNSKDYLDMERSRDNWRQAHDKLTEEIANKSRELSDTKTRLDRLHEALATSSVVWKNPKDCDVEEDLEKARKIVMESRGNTYADVPRESNGDET